MPLHFLQVIRLPAWLIKHVDRLRRGFLWRGTNICKGGHCLVNWDTCCMPKINGGLGIIDLRAQNDALMLKWLWTLISNPDSAWTHLIQDLYGTTDPTSLNNSSLVSPQLRDILILRSLLNVSTTLLNSSQPPTLSWRWTSHGRFSAASAYAMLKYAGQTSVYHRHLWKIKAPPKVRVFLWLLIRDKLLTQHNLQKRGWPSIHSCVLCTHHAEETTMHLFSECPFVFNTWQAIAAQFNLPLNISFNEPLWFWLRNISLMSDDRRPTWDTLWSASCWTI
ncbi:RNA-directed DNA polymerase (reverse transcriptase)-related family protein [Rhynchospora pubera]|uniref:RNA-directed DNA polymerase (Reverse transcriptase)-related family protein n=1 Tax=Rhynchospora pubera TaxID=906938 RepID=A0AAV8AQ35_9POAL|nr:RNA-directed DNA polymerase (reverse transcriptase)-related family protein [Rhynchospora pubera]